VRREGAARPYFPEEREMAVQTSPCRNAGELFNPMQVRTDSGETKEFTHRCMQPHTAQHEYFNLTDGICPFEGDCPHFEAVEQQQAASGE
jgi:hypothetical protein